MNKVYGHNVNDLVPTGLYILRETICQSTWLFDLRIYKNKILSLMSKYRFVPTNQVASTWPPKLGPSWTNSTWMQDLQYCIYAWPLFIFVAKHCLDHIVNYWSKIWHVWHHAYMLWEHKTFNHNLEFHTFVCSLDLSCVPTSFQSSLFATTLNMVISVTYLLEFHNVLSFCYWCRFLYWVTKVLIVYNVETTNLTFVGKIWYIQ